MLITVACNLRWTVPHKNIAYSCDKVQCFYRESSMFVKSTWHVLIWSANYVQPAPSWLAEQIETIKCRHKHWTLSVKTLNFVIRIDNVLSVTVHPLLWKFLWISHNPNINSAPFADVNLSNFALWKTLL